LPEHAAIQIQQAKRESTHRNLAIEFPSRCYITAYRKAGLPRDDASPTTFLGNLCGEAL
jgi:hypothetical protein